MKLQKHELVDAFSEAVGEQKAERMIERATTDAGVSARRTLSKEDALAVFDQIANDDDVGSMVRVSANTLKTQIRSGQLGS